MLQSDLEDNTFGTLCRGAHLQHLRVAGESCPTAGISRSIAQDRKTPETFLSNSINSKNDVSTAERMYFSFSD